MTSPVLPSSRDGRIALARRTIERCLLVDDQADPEHYAVMGADTLVEFRVLVHNHERATDLYHAVADAIMLDAGFAAISYQSPRLFAGGPEVVCTIRVPVGAP